MMKRVNYQDYQEKVQKNSKGIVNRINRRAPRRRTRDLGETRALGRLALVAWEKAVSSGKLKKMGDRRYGLRIDA